MEEEEGYMGNDDVPLTKPSKKPKDKQNPRRGLGVAELEKIIAEQEQPLLRESNPITEHHKSFGRASPDTVVTPLTSTSNLKKSITQNFPVSSFSEVPDLGHSVLSKGYFLPPQQFPVVPYRQEMAMTTQEHSTIYPCHSPLMIPLPAITPPVPVVEKHGPKRVPPRFVHETDKTGWKRWYHIPSRPPLWGPNPNLHPIGRGLQPASTDFVGRFHAPRNVAIRPLDSSPASIPNRFSSNNQRERSNPDSGSRKIAPPANNESLEQRLTPGGEFLTLAPPGNVQSELILNSRQQPDTQPDHDDSRIIPFEDLRSSSAQDGYTSLPFHTFLPEGPVVTSQVQMFDDSEEYDPDIDIELRL